MIIYDDYVMTSSTVGLEAVVHPRKENVSVPNTEKCWKWSSAKKFKAAVQKPCVYSEKVLLSDLNENSSPTEVFETLNDINEMMRLIAEESERYACQKGRSFSTSIPELKDFLGMNFAMALNKQSTVKSYWATEDGLGNSKHNAKEKFFEYFTKLAFFK